MRIFLTALIIAFSLASAHTGHATNLQTLQQAADYLGKITSKPVRPYSTRDFGRERFLQARSVIVAPEQAEPAIKKIRPLLAPGLVAFVGTTNNLATPKIEGVEIVVGKGRDQFAILRIAASDAVNYDKSTGDLIKKLEEWDKKYGIDIWQAETDTIQLRLKSLPKNVRAFAEEVYQFCPDIVDQGTGSVAALEKEIRQSKSLFLWWD